VQSPPLESAMHAYPASWKDSYRQALQESDEQKLTELCWPQKAQLSTDFKNLEILSIAKNAWI